MCIVPAAMEDLVDTLQSTEATLATFVGDRAARARALHTALRGHILADVAAPFQAMLDPVPKYVLLRPSPAHEWTPHSFRKTLHNHCIRASRNSFSLSPQLSAADFGHIGSVLSLPYAGPWSHCHGDVASFLPVPADLPHFPADMPVRLRPTYWTLPQTGGTNDLLISSLDGVLQSLVASIRGVAEVSCASSWLAALNVCLRVCCDDDLGRASFLSEWASFLQAPESEWLRRPRTLARPFFLSDYRLLGPHLGLHYLGVRTEDRTLRRDVVPHTLLSLTAVFAETEVAPSSDQDWDEFWDRCTQTSYIQAHLRWQNQVPTFARMRTVLKQLDAPTDAGLDASTLDRVLAEFPAAPRAIVEVVCTEVLHACMGDAYSALTTGNALTAALQLLHTSEELSPLHSDPACQDVAARVAQLRQTELAEGCNDLTHPQPPLKRKARRRAGALGEQRLSGPSASGLRIAFHRGLRFLISAYGAELSKHAKRLARVSATRSGSLPSTGEDIDLENRSQPLPLSPVLLSYVSSLADMSRWESQMALWSRLRFFAQGAANHLLTEAQHCAAPVDTSHLERWYDESGIAHLFPEATECPSQPGPLTDHELLLGFSFMMLHRIVSPSWDAQTGKQLRRKTDIAPARRCNILLSMFSVASLLELTEQWFSLPVAPAGCPRNVCNMDALEIRSLAKLVHDEREVSARPLVQHVCAACGNLLAPHMPQRKTSNNETGIPAISYQVLGSPCDAFAMPPFLLLFSKALLARRLPAVFEYSAATNALRLRTPKAAPWMNYLAPPKHEEVDLRRPWWYCKPCWRYWQASPNARRCRISVKEGELPETTRLRAALQSATALERVPMRNKFEGYFTAWHRDLAFNHLEPALRRLYPDHPTLPTAAEVLAWRVARKSSREALQAVFSGQGGTSHVQRENAFLVQAKLRAQELEWAPPPRESIFKTPIPERYFLAALGSSVREWAIDAVDLVPVEQPDLMQDVPGCPAFQVIRSADARACIALCRPVGQIVEKRVLPAKKGVLPTMPHQSGSLALSSLAPAQDDARGMLTGIVAKDSFSKDMFQLQPLEAAALEEVLPWLLDHNPWLAAYKTSLGEVRSELAALQEHMKQVGRLLPGGLESVRTQNGKSLADALGEEEVALLLPLDALKACSGSYAHLRTMADTICTSELRSSLPPSWQHVCANEVCDADGAPISSLPHFLDINTALTKVSFRDSHVEAKLFVKMFPWGTGSFSSALDCIKQRHAYAQARFWSLDGEFLDDQEPQWLFWQREFEYKMRLFEDWHGKDNPRATPQSHVTGEVRSQAPADTKAQHTAAYSKHTFSRRVGSFIPDSSQALTRQRYDWLEAAKPENLGPPTSMTTFVGNPKSAAVVAHVTQGPCALPDPETSLSFLVSGTATVPTTRHVAVKEVDYLRRRADFEMVAFDPSSRDTLHGQIPHRCSRSENQKRGDDHTHYNEFAEPCGFPPHASEMEALHTAGISQVPPASAAQCVEVSPTTPIECQPCRTVSRYCVRSAGHCHLPSCLHNADFHAAAHHAYARGELVRAFPVGHEPVCPPRPPDVSKLTLAQTRQHLRETFFAATPATHQADSPLLPLWRRLLLALSSDDFFPTSSGAAATLSDIVASFYYRALQVGLFVHVCKIGYCRHSWADACRFDLPASNVTLEQCLDEVSWKLLPVRRHLPDDAYLKVRHGSEPG